MKYNEEDRDNEIKKIQKSDLSESDMKNRIEFCHRHFKLAQDKNKKLRMFSQKIRRGQSMKWIMIILKELPKFIQVYSRP